MRLRRFGACPFVAGLLVDRSPALDPGQIPVEVDGVVACQVAPELGSIDDLEAVVLLTHPLLTSAELAAESSGVGRGEHMVGGVWLSLIEVGRIPPEYLGLGRVEPDLVHQTVASARVRHAPVPQTLVEDENRSCRAFPLTLAPHVAVPTHLGLVDPAEMCARHEPRSAAIGGNFVREIEDLDVERGRGVDGGISVKRLHRQVASSAQVYEVVVEPGGRTHEALDRTCHARVAEHLSESRTLGVDLRDRLARTRSKRAISGAPGVEDLAALDRGSCIEVVCDDTRQCQETTRSERRNLFGGEELIAH